MREKKLEKGIKTFLAWYKAVKVFALEIRNSGKLFCSQSVCI